MQKRGPTKVGKLHIFGTSLRQWSMGECTGWWTRIVLLLLGRHCSCPGRNCIEFNNKHILYDFSSSFWYTVANSVHLPSLPRLPDHLGLFCSMSLICAVLVGLPWWLHNVIFCDYTAPLLLLLPLLRLPLVSQLGVVGTYCNVLLQRWYGTDGWGGGWCWWYYGYGFVRYLAQG